MISMFSNSILLVFSIKIVIDVVLFSFWRTFPQQSIRFLYYIVLSEPFFTFFLLKHSPVILVS